MAQEDPNQLDAAMSCGSQRAALAGIEKLTEGIFG
jgi:hypothetical protein